MATLPPLDEQVIPELLERLQAPEASRRLRAAAALGRFGARTAEAVPALVGRSRMRMRMSGRWRRWPWATLAPALALRSRP